MIEPSGRGPLNNSQPLPNVILERMRQVHAPSADYITGRRRRGIPAAGHTIRTPVQELVNKPKCSIDGCDKDSIAHDWCSKHYERWRRHGHAVCGEPGCPKNPTHDGHCIKHDYLLYREGRR